MEENEAAAAAPEPSPSQLGIFKKRIHLLCDSNTGDFDAWVSLISAAEETSANSIEVISLVYCSFLMEFPLCYGYWIQYAAHKARLCTHEDVVEVYEQAVQAIPHSVDLWVSYCGFGICAYEDPADIRSLFERALSLVGKDYLCYHLWDKYMEFEYSQKQLIQLATLYINTLKFPTKKLHQYYESFKKLVTLLEEVTHCGAETSSESVHTYEVIVADETEGDISTKIAALFDQKDGHLSHQALKQYLFTGEHLYQRSRKIDEEISCFETSIKRPFFHVRPLDDGQLENWHQYLDFVEKNGDFDWAVKLYERCLIPCANYSEFWIRYAEFVDSKGGREIANYALRRASSCFAKGVPIFSMYYAMFKEQIGDAPGARSLFVEGSSNFTSDYCMNVNRLANMEKRMGNTKAASEIYETAIEDAMQKQNIEVLTDLYTNFAQFKYAASRSIVEAKEIFLKGIKQVPSKSLIKGFIQFMSTHGGPTEVSPLDSVISNAMIPGSDMSTALSSKDREDISLLFLEFVDLYGSVTELRKAWARHSKLFPHNTRDLLQRYRAKEISMQENNKRRRMESMKVSPDNSPEDKATLKQLSKNDTCSLLFDKEVQSQVDKNTVGSGTGQSNSDDQNMSRSIDAYQVVGDTAQECIDMVHSKHSLCKSGIENQMNSHSNQEICRDLSLCEQDDQATKSYPASSEKAPQAKSCKGDSPSKSFAASKEIDTQDKAKAIDLSVSGHPGQVCLRSDSPSGSSLPKERSLSNPVRVSPGLEKEQLEKIQVDLETDHAVSSCENANPEKSTDNTDAITCAREISALSQDHIQSSQPHPLSVCIKPFSSEIATTQSTTCTKFSPNTAVTSQAQVHQQMGNSQMCQSNNLSLHGQNMQQQQAFAHLNQTSSQTQNKQAFAMPQNIQTSSQTQCQPFAHLNQENQQYVQIMHGYASQMWKYYQQQMYYLQAQHNQQMQSLQQQHLPTEHLQQNFMQQVQQLNQQMVLWQQQVQQQQQLQAHPVQQQSDKKDGPHHLSSGDNKHERNEQKQQESQMDYQSQNLQQQQMLYFQQQQQQMYLMQQQQMYEQQQQQQLMQQQLLQMPQQNDLVQQQQLFQQQQQQIFQQQQQQLFQQQQQQMVLLQQQFIQQQMQQQLQKKADPEGFKDQNHELNPQDTRSWQMEHGQQFEASQSDGSKLRNAEQSELSYPSTPQSQRSNH